jgi:hypothetical protein
MLQSERPGHPGGLASRSQFLLQTVITFNGGLQSASHIAINLVSVSLVIGLHSFKSLNSRVIYRRARFLHYVGQDIIEKHDDITFNQ